MQSKALLTSEALCTLYHHYDLSQSFPCATPRELEGVRRCAAAGRAGDWQLRTGLAESGCLLYTSDAADD